MCARVLIVPRRARWVMHRHRHRRRGSRRETPAGVRRIIKRKIWFQPKAILTNIAVYRTDAALNAIKPIHENRGSYGSCVRGHACSPPPPPFLHRRTPDTNKYSLCLRFLPSTSSSPPHPSAHPPISGDSGPAARVGSWPRCPRPPRASPSALLETAARNRGLTHTAQAKKIDATPGGSRRQYGL